MERRRAEKAETAPVASRQDLQSQLSIDKEALDDCLMSQPDLYYHVAEAYADAVAERDAAKLNLEQVSAELDQQFRLQAAQAEEKITEAALQRKLAAAPRIQTLERGLLDLRATADKWLALKEAFQQRSFMLRELVAMLIARLGNTSLERSVQASQRDLADANHKAAGEMRAQRRAGAER